MNRMQCLFLFLFLPAMKLNATVWVVNQNGTGNFRLIQEAINNPGALSGDTIFLAPSVHFEQGINNAGKSLTFLGAGYDVSMIIGGSFSLTQGSHRMSGIRVTGGVLCSICDSIVITSTVAVFGVHDVGDLVIVNRS